MISMRTLTCRWYIMICLRIPGDTTEGHYITVYGNSRYCIRLKVTTDVMCSTIYLLHAVTISLKDDKQQYCTTPHQCFCVHHLVHATLTWILQLPFAGLGGTLIWNTWPTTAEESWTPVSSPSVTAADSWMGGGCALATADKVAWNSDSAKDCMDASSSTDIISTTVSCCPPGSVPWARATSRPIIRGIVLPGGSLLLLETPQLRSLRLQCIVTGPLALRQMSENNRRGHMRRREAGRGSGSSGTGLSSKTPPSRSSALRCDPWRGFHGRSSSVGCRMKESIRIRLVLNCNWLT